MADRHPMDETGIERLLGEQPFLNRLARRLVRDEASAADLVQETNVRALSAAPREGASLRAWLATVVRRVASRERRGEGRRVARERSGARDEAKGDDFEALDRRLDAHAQLLSLLRDLPRDQRRALFLRYAEDLSPAAIAQRLGAPLETIKTRLRRGRERLRADLDARHGDRRTWATLLLGAPHLPLPEAVAAASLTTLTGAIALSTATKIGALAATAALLAWATLRETTGAAPEVAPALSGPHGAALSEPAAEVAGARPPARDEGREPAASGAQAHPYPIVISPPTRSYAGAAWWLDVRTEGASGSGAELSVTARRAEYGGTWGEALKETLNAAGRARLDIGPYLRRLADETGVGPPRELVVEVDAPNASPSETRVLLPDPLELDTEEELTAVVTLEEATLIEGRLVLEDSNGELPEAWVAAYAMEDARPARESGETVRPDAEGYFRLRLKGAGAYALLAAVKDHRPATRLVHVAPRGRVDLGDVLCTRGLAIDGFVLGADGRSAGDLPVSAGLVGIQDWVRTDGFSYDMPMHYAWFAGAFELFGANARTDERGRFVLGGLGPHEYEVRADRPDMRLPSETPVVCEPPRTLELRPMAAHVTVQLTLPNDPEENGTVRWTVGAGAAEQVVQNHSVHSTGLYLASVVRAALPPDADVVLEIEFPGLEPGRLELRTPAAGRSAEHALVLRESAVSATLGIVLRGAELADDTPIRVRAETPDGGVRDITLYVKGGRIEIDDIEPGSFSASLTVGADWLAPLDHLREVRLEAFLAAGERAERTVHFERGGGLVLEAFDPSGKRVFAGCRVSDASGERSLTFVAWGADGSRVAGENMLFERGPSRAVPELEPGTYTVRVTASDLAPFDTTVEIRAGETTERRLDLAPR